MNLARDQFLQNLARIRDLQSLYLVLKASTVDAVDLSDILRACLVLAVSALDHAIHEFARLGILEMYNNQRDRTDSFGRLPILLDTVLQSLASPGSSQWLEEAIRKQHSWISFQQSDKIADAIRLISNKKLWDEVALVLKSDAKSVKNQLNLIVDRRNKIAHEADMDPSAPGMRWPIDESLTAEAINAIDRIVNAIFLVVTTP